MQGRRLQVPPRGIEYAVGDYWKNEHGQWMACTPGDFLAALRLHNVEEHEDGTITVSPSILCREGDRVWHGYLERGVWRSV